MDALMLAPLRSALAHRIPPATAPNRQFQVFRSLSTARFHTTSTQASSTAAATAVTAAPPGWAGLDAWRAAGINDLRVWGDKGPESAPFSPSQSPAASLAEYARRVLLCPDPLGKADLTHQAWRAFQTGNLPIGVADPPPAPARPSKPELVPSHAIPSARASGLPPPVYTLHNLLHVELNAVDLAWDTVCRFASLKLPLSFYADFARVADDEGRHLRWCLQRIRELGYNYGCMPAHCMLWDGCAASAGELGARLAVVPLSQEARGLDAGARLAERLVGWGDVRTARIVSKIAEEERAHVGVGVAWFGALAAAEGADAGRKYAEVVTELCPDLISGAGGFNHAAREEVGLLRAWYDETQWPEDLQAAAVAAHAAAKERALAEKAAAASEGVMPQGLRPAESGTPSAGRLGVEELRARLLGLLEIEGAAVGV